MSDKNTLLIDGETQGIDFSIQKNSEQYCCASYRDLVLGFYRRGLHQQKKLREK